MAELLNEHTFVASGADPVPVEDVHGDNGLENINQDAPEEKKVNENPTDISLKVSGNEDNGGKVHTLRKKLPNKVTESSLAKSTKLDSLLDNVEKIEKVSDSVLTNLNTTEIFKLSDEMNGLQKLITGREGVLTQDDLANAGKDPVVTTGLILLAVDRLVGKNLDVFDYVRNTKINKFFKSHTLDRIMEIAAEYGAVDLVKKFLRISDLAESVKYKDPKRQNKMIKNILSYFQWGGDIYIDELNEEDTYILASIEQITNGYRESENNKNLTKKREVLTKDQQATYLVDVLYDIQPNWMDTYIGGLRATNLDYFQYASHDAIEALLKDPRTRSSAVVYNFNHDVRPGPWFDKAKLMYPDLYAPAGY